MKTLLASAALSLLLSACAGQIRPPSGEAAFYQGTIKRVCSPVDATGLELRLEKQTGSGPPLAIIQLWSPLPSAGSDPVALTGTEKTGSLMICHSEQDCQLLQRGFVLIETENQLGPSTGIFWSSAGQVHGRFSAEPVDDGELICG